MTDLSCDQRYAHEVQRYEKKTPRCFLRDNENAFLRRNVLRFNIQDEMWYLEKDNPPINLKSIFL